jgi:hypothetical protein
MLTLVSVLVIAGAVCFGVIATLAERSRAHAADAVRAQTEPLLVQAATLYAALSDANATATTTFLKGGLEPPARRARYSRDLRLASGSLATLTREVGGSADARARVATITQQLPVYSGLVDTARANNRQGLPIGAAYLRQASGLLTATILPRADQLYSIEAARLGSEYATGTSTIALAILVAVAVVGIALLIATQLYLSRLTHRVLNVPLLVATVVLAVVSIWAIAGLIGEQNALAKAQTHGSDAVAVLSATRVLVSRAQSDQSLTLANRGSDQLDPVDLARITRALAPPGGLIGEVQSLAGRTASAGAATRLATDFSAYRTRAAQIRRLQDSGQIGAAIAVATAPSSAEIADRLDANLTEQIASAQGRFDAAASDATSSLSGLSIAIPVLTALIAALALVGLRQRLREYR